MAQDPTLSRRTRPGIDGCAHAHGIDGTQVSCVARDRGRAATSRLVAGTLSLRLGDQGRAVARGEECRDGGSRNSEPTTCPSRSLASTRGRLAEPLPRSSRSESSAIRYEAGRFDRSTLSIRVVARTGGNLSETTAWLSRSPSPSTHCHVRRRSRAVEDFEISKSSRVRRERSGERTASLSREGEMEPPLRSTRRFLKELSAPALLGPHDTACDL